MQISVNNNLIASQSFTLYASFPNQIFGHMKEKKAQRQKSSPLIIIIYLFFFFNGPAFCETLCSDSDNNKLE